MTKPLPRVTEVVSLNSPKVLVRWADGTDETVDLAGWIATGGNVLAPLESDAVFNTVRLGDYGASIEWGPEDGDLAIDAHHLHQLAVEQRPFMRSDLVAWQGEAGLSNQEAAEFLGISLSTWNAYKAGGPIPNPVRMVCRASLRDPVMLHAHYRPRKPGRPPRTIEAGAA
jgi:hypothetical protein